MRKFEQTHMTTVVVKALKEVIRMFDWSPINEIREIQRKEMDEYEKLLRHIQSGEMDVRLTPRNY